MPDDPKRKAARKSVKTAQKRFEREQDKSRVDRRKAFAQAREDGLTLRDIAEEAGLHHSSVSDIIDGK